MERLNIICVDDQRTVLNTLVKDLLPFEGLLNIEECESADEAFEVIDEVDAEGGFIALIISDHVMPGKSGVEFLSGINQDGRFKNTKKILLTGLATHQDTIQAINQAGIQRYMEKPWEEEILVQNVKELLTEFLFDQGLEYQPFRQIIDQKNVLERLKTQV